MVDENNIDHKSHAFVVHETQSDASTRGPIISTFVDHFCQVLILILLLLLFLASPSTFKATSITPTSQNLKKRRGKEDHALAN
jgi:hypothetical protein